MTMINHVEIREEELILAVDLDLLPNTNYIGAQYQSLLHNCWENDMVGFLQWVTSKPLVEVSFLPTDYVDLAEHLKHCFTYSLAQARLIIKWIEDNVAQTGDNIPWHTTYAEILERAEC